MSVAVAGAAAGIADVGIRILDALNHEGYVFVYTCGNPARARTEFHASPIFYGQGIGSDRYISIKNYISILV